MTLSLCWNIFSLELRKAFSYRVDFWIKFLVTLAIDVCVAYFLWSAIYAAQSEQTIGGFTFFGMLLYSILAPLVARAAAGADFGSVSSDIYQGSLTRYIVQPVNYFVYKAIGHLVATTMAVFQLLIVLSLFFYFAGVPAETHFTPASLAMGVFANLVAAYLYFAFLTFVELTAFWFDNVWNLGTILRMMIRLLGGGFVPLSLFPKAAEQVLLVLPFNFIVYFPIKSYLGQISFEDWLAGISLAVVWGLVITGGYVAVWKKGQRTYTGVGI
jgi:ABC-2 type transport system permease protein